LTTLLLNHTLKSVLPLEYVRRYELEFDRHFHIWRKIKQAQMSLNGSECWDDERNDAVLGRSFRELKLS
jgi:hypothetical protein